MTSVNRLEVALSGFDTVAGDWMAATAIRPLVFDDPAIVWLEHHGAAHGFEPERTDYDFIDFIGRKGREFETKWTSEIAPGAPRVCREPWEVRGAEKVRQTVELMRQGVPVIAQPALWWASEGIYGVPDLIVRSTWVVERLPRVELSTGRGNDPYLVLDIKFTTKLDTSAKARDFENYGVQVRLYSYMLGQLQGHMPDAALLITRDRVDSPLLVRVKSDLKNPLDPDLAVLRDRYLDIKLNGTAYTPWTHDEVAYNLANDDERWNKAKLEIARDRVKGADPALIVHIGMDAKLTLTSRGYPNLEALLAAQPDEVPLELCKGIGEKRARQIRAILDANRTGVPRRPPGAAVPDRRTHEFFIDFEYLNNLNVEFDAQWPGLEGREMIFMVGVGRETEGQWLFRAFTAAAETPEAELEMLTEFLAFLDSASGGRVTDRDATALYHWSNPEVWQCKRAADRHELPEEHALRRLPWRDLQKVFQDGPGALPGALNFGLKTVSKALANYDATYATVWPGALDEGLKAAVMGWRVYEHAEPLDTSEMSTLQEYLTADCQALWNILRWLRLP
ncbi:MAG: ribonuclease H-like domain-containing protein [Proteobacteria bacterium]|nr:ribonuclease H-like domain-containing protein [Pseudomonadota bacterium]